MASDSSAKVYELDPEVSRIAVRSANSSARRSTWAVMVTAGISTSGSGLV